MNEPIIISSRAAKQVQEFMDAARRINEQAQTYVEALAAALDVPAGWQLDVQRMAFVEPPAAQGAPDAPPQEDPDNAG